MADVTADRGADPTELPEVREYLSRLAAEGRGLPADRLAEVLDDVRSHVRDAVSTETASGADPAVAARNALERLGPPAEIVRAEAEQSGLPTAGTAPGGPGLMQRVGEPVAIFLLLFGGFLFVVGWLVGVLLLWLTPTWRLREKLLGTFVWPFGFLSVLFFGGTVTYVESCSERVTSAGDTARLCTGGAPYPDWVGAVIAVVVIGAPIVVAALLWRRRQAVLDGRAS